MAAVVVAVAMIMDVIGIVAVTMIMDVIGIAAVTMIMDAIGIATMIRLQEALVTLMFPDLLRLVAVKSPMSQMRNAFENGLNTV